MSLLEGHADVVMDGVGPVGDPVGRPDPRPSSPSVAPAPGRWTRWCAGCSASTPSCGSTATARRFVRGVVDKVGMDGFNAVWAEPDQPAGQGRDRRPGAVGAPGPRLRAGRAGRDSAGSTRPSPHVRRAVRTSAPTSSPGAAVVVACSGGADSMALAAAAVFEAGKAGWLVACRCRRPRAAARVRATSRRGRRPAARARLRAGRRVVAVDGRHGGRTGGRRQGARYAALTESAADATTPSCCSDTPSTTRRRRCCSGWPGEAALRSLAGMAAVARPASAGHCSAATRGDTEQACLVQGSRPGTTRTTTTPVRAGPGAA